MTREQLIKQIRDKKSFLCVGLDPDVSKIPQHIIEDDEDTIYLFNRLIIDATAPYCVAFKPNTAFYEAYGLSGMESLEKTIKYIKLNYPDHFLIADAKRGDIGNTSTMYAKAFFNRLNADAITIAPYMGSDSVKPFLAFENKWAIVLGLTSNEGSADFQQLKLNDKELYLKVIETCASWGTANNMMFVIGATKASMLGEIRKLIPNHFLLVPGVGAQGGSLEEVTKYGLNKDIGLLINASRSIIYAGNGENFDVLAGLEAKKLNDQMKTYF
ncbi:MAG: orotidine-5'-phosphate decarboxylase [Bacteroidetes bacterium]|jgi:orotidine-5'-phosphate decarboxylase|nr:orotidine-5'-phosphate decarboxylase [Bacteroidota bacterium]MCA6444519.1 orotidine-5'-phosphate decarboxylase [Bacteroidota bacterium]